MVLADFGCMRACLGNVAPDVVDVRMDLDEVPVAVDEV